MTTQLSVCKNVENYDVHKNYFPFSYPEKEASLSVEQFRTNCSL